MAIFRETILTEKGYELANKAANGQGSFKITRVVSSDKDYSTFSNNELGQLSKLDSEIDGQIIDQNDENSKVTKIKTNYTNESNPNGYSVSAIGLYAKDSDDNREYLYAVTVANEKQIIPPNDENNSSIFSGFELTIYVLVGNTQKMKIDLYTGGAATIDYVNKTVSGLAKNTDVNDQINKAMNAVSDAREYVNTHGSDILSLGFSSAKSYTDQNISSLSNQNNDELNKAMNAVSDAREYVNTHGSDILSLAFNSAKSYTDDKNTTIKSDIGRDWDIKLGLNHAKPDVRNLSLMADPNVISALQNSTYNNIIISGSGSYYGSGDIWIDGIAYFMASSVNGFRDNFMRLNIKPLNVSRIVSSDFHGLPMNAYISSDSNWIIFSLQKVITYATSYFLDSIRVTVE